MPITLPMFPSSSSQRRGFGLADPKGVPEARVLLANAQLYGQRPADSGPQLSRFMWCIAGKVQAFAALYPHSPQGYRGGANPQTRARGTKKKPNAAIGPFTHDGGR
jgi:hypothetical protein